MLLSYSHQFLFVHVPRTAGVSVTASLTPYAHRPEENGFNRTLDRFGLHTNLYFGPHTWRWFRIHHSAEVIRRHLPLDLYNRLFKFAFVRNPWDRAVSFYHHCLEQPRHHRHKIVKKMSFEEFLTWRVKRRPLLQCDTVADRRGELLVDYLGRFETIAEDFNEICRRVGIEVRLQKLNRSQHRDYRSYFNDKTAEMAAEYWRRDIDRFGYTFDGVAEETTPATISFTEATKKQAVEALRRRAAA